MKIRLAAFVLLILSFSIICLGSCNYGDLGNEETESLGESISSIPEESVPQSVPIYTDPANTVADKVYSAKTSEHRIKKNRCEICDVDCSSKLCFSISTDGGHYILKGIGECEDKIIHVPAVYNGKPVTQIHKNAFSDSDPVAIFIGADVEFIDPAAFDGCGVKILSVDKGNDFYTTKNNALYTKNGKTLIKYAEGCEDGFFEVGSSVSEISDFAFRNAENLERVVISEGVNKIGDYSFAGCSSLSEITFEYGVKSIGVGAFSSCEKLYSIDIPDSVSNLGEYAFSRCESLCKANIGDGIKRIGERTFEDCVSLMSVYISDTVEYIGNYAFLHCQSLRFVKLPAALKSIGSHTFYGCTELMAVDIPDSVSEIGAYAFYGCSNLSIVMIGSEINKISARAFDSCKEDLSVYYKGSRDDWDDFWQNCEYFGTDSFDIYTFSSSKPDVEGNFWHYDENGRISVYNQ